MIDVIVHQGTLGVGDRVLHGTQLLDDLQTRVLFLEHFGDTPQTALRAFEVVDDLYLWVRFV